MRLLKASVRIGDELRVRLKGDASRQHRDKDGYDGDPQNRHTELRATLGS